MSGVAADWLRVREGGVELRVRVIPGSAREGVAGLYGDRLKIRVRPVADRNAANEALCRLVAKAAVVGSAVGPGPSPVAKAAVVGAAVTPGRRRF